ncbi:hypothetical protein CONLIGDRAFT_695381 [Coniochaeta ligniaria NRRL 30616]|uniref:Uncharacterized protein n=1 Tax=Coniochaeta ligniaria NRRL 30616 TaxID=1408157 RepID=A0A1J7J0N5_9PEZI|nr:hypothetical protein CONLIGDRAFT_695381 [Coniochaeta ligniaria NRRL 30616]
MGNSPRHQVWYCCQCDTPPESERKLHGSTTSKREGDRGQTASSSLPVDLVSSADRPPAYNGAGNTIDREKAHEGENRSKQHRNDFSSTEVCSACKGDRGRGKGGDWARPCAMLRNCRHCFPLRESQPLGEISNGVVDGGLHDKDSVWPAWEERRCTWPDDETPRHHSLISIGTGHDRGKADIGICWSGATEEVRPQAVEREPYQGSELVCKHASTSPLFRTIDWCSILVGGIATLAILDINAGKRPRYVMSLAKADWFLGMCPHQGTDHRPLTELSLRSNLSYSLRWPCFPLYLAAICAYSAVGIYHLVRRPRHWADCGLLAVKGSILTGAWLGRRAMVDALILGAFLSLVCSRAIDCILDRQSTGTKPDGDEEKYPLLPIKGQSNPHIPPPDGVWRCGS